MIFQCNVKYCLGPCEPVTFILCSFIYQLHIFVGHSHFYVISTWLRLCLNKMSLLLFTTLVKHTRKKIKHTRAGAGACSVVQKNLIFSHFQNICSTFTHFQSSLAFAFPKFQYLRYSWHQRPEPRNCLLREEKYPLNSVKKSI